MHIESMIEIRGVAYDVAGIRNVSGEVVWCLREQGTQQPLYACVRAHPHEPHKLTIIHAREYPRNAKREGTIPDRFYHSRDGEPYRPTVELSDASGKLEVTEQ